MSILLIRETYRQRMDLLRAEGSLTRQIKSIDRRLSEAQLPSNGQVLTSISKPNQVLTAQLAARPLFEARDIIHKEKLGLERMLVKQVKQLPAYEFVEKTRGFGALAFAMIVGEAGDLSNYSNPSKLWKRMGLAVIDGKRQRKHLDKDKALQHGYCPRRRSTMYIIGESLIKQGREYKVLYDEFKVYEQHKSPVELQPIVYHRRALRKMEKRLLVDLWVYWNALITDEKPRDHLASVIYKSTAPLKTLDIPLPA